MTGKEFEQALKELDLTTTAQAAARYKVHRSTIRRAITNKPSRYLKERVEQDLENHGRKNG